MNKLNLLIKMKRIGQTQKREKKNVFKQKVSFYLSEFFVIISALSGMKFMNWFQKMNHNFFPCLSPRDCNSILTQILADWDPQAWLGLACKLPSSAWLSSGNFSSNLSLMNVSQDIFENWDAQAWLSSQTSRLSSARDISARTHH